MQDNIAIELFLLCDKACKHCGSYATLSGKHDKSSMTMETVLEILKQIVWTNEHRRMTKTRVVHLTGGEPFMWQDGDKRIGDAVRAIQENGFEAKVLSSGTHPTDKGYKRYLEGVDSVRGLDFPVYHSFNLYMAGANIVDRLKYTIPLFDGALGTGRELGFFGVYDRSNRGATLDACDDLMEYLGFRFVESQSTHDWRVESRKGEEIELAYVNGDRAADFGFSQADVCAGRARKFNLKPIRVTKTCYVADVDSEGIQPVIGHDGNVYPCWAGPFPDTRPIGNIFDDHLSTILGRERAYLKAFKECLEADYDGRTNICRFCVDVSKDCLAFQFAKD